MVIDFTSVLSYRFWHQLQRSPLNIMVFLMKKQSLHCWSQKAADELQLSMCYKSKHHPGRVTGVMNKPPTGPQTIIHDFLGHDRGNP